MTAIFRNIMSFLFGLYFLLAGTGFNIVNYCCESCEVQGIEYVAEHSCNTVHDHNDNACCETHSESHEDMVCSDFHHQPKNCHILRLKVEIPSIVSAYDLTHTASVIQVLFANQLFSFSLPAKQIENLLSDLPPPPSDIQLPTGRDILISKSVFLI